MRMFTGLYFLWFVLVALYQPVISFPLTASQRKMTHIFHRSNVFQGSTARLKLGHSNSGAGPRKRTRTMVQMKDASCAYWFQVGDKVKVSSSVIKGGVDLKGRLGVVTNTWEKCDVDPTCCCAEFVDDNFAVTVKFEGKLDLGGDTSSDEFIKGIDTFTHYFNEQELTKMKEEDMQEEEKDIPSSAAFDGMSCKAFKLDQLKMGKQAQRIAAFEKSRTEEL